MFSYSQTTELGMRQMVVFTLSSWLAGSSGSQPMPSLSCAPTALREERDLEDDLPTACECCCAWRCTGKGCGCVRVWLECVEKRWCACVCVCAGREQKVNINILTDLHSTHFYASVQPFTLTEMWGELPPAWLATNSCKLPQGVIPDVPWKWNLQLCSIHTQ